MGAPTTRAVDGLVPFVIAGTWVANTTFRALCRLEVADGLGCRIGGVAKDQADGALRSHPPQLPRPPMPKPCED